MNTDLDSLAQPLRAFVPGVLAATNTPGAAVAIADPAGAVWAEGFGFADLAQRTLITPDTVFQGGSMAKPYVATAVLQLAERGLVDLNRPVNDYVDAFPVRNPCGGGEVTLLSLLTHSSGLRTDGYDASQATPPSLPLYLAAAYQRARGHEYHGGPLWTEPVGARYQYSSLGMATLGHVVELVTGRDYPDYVAEHIFDPLGMTASAIAPPYAPTPAHATGYASLGTWCVPSPVLQSGTFPSTRLETTAADAVRLLAALLRGGAGPRGRILAPETVSDMLTLRMSGALPGEPKDFSRVGLGIQLRDHDSPPWYGHGGAYPFGFACESRAYPRAGIAVAVLCNAWDAVRYVNPGTRSPAGLIARYAGRLASGEAAPRCGHPPRASWDNSYAMGLLLAERIRGLLGDRDHLAPHTVNTMVAGTRTLSGDAPDPWHASGFAAGVADVNALPVATPSVIRDFLRARTRVTKAELDVIALGWGASRAELPVPMRFWADLADQHDR